jgi:hypothetical protein
MLMPPTVVEAVLPAASVAVPVTDWLAPSPVSVTGAVTDTPGRLSAAVKLTTTSVLFHPFVFAAGVREPAIVGGVVSSVTTVEATADWPNESVAWTRRTFAPAARGEDSE